MQPVIRIHIRVVRARIVVHRILDELEPRQAHCVVAQMVRATCIPIRDRAHPKVGQRRNPLLEDRPNRSILLRIHPPNLTRPVIQIVVSVQRLPFVRRRQRPMHAHICGDTRLCRRIVERPKVLLHIPDGPKQPLLFA